MRCQHLHCDFLTVTRAESCRTIEGNYCTWCLWEIIVFGDLKSVCVCVCVEKLLALCLLLFVCVVRWRKLLYRDLFWFVFCMCVCVCEVFNFSGVAIVENNCVDKYCVLRLYDNTKEKIVQGRKVLWWKILYVTENWTG